MSIYLEPKNLIVLSLRVNIDDPRNRINLEKSESVSASSEKIFAVTASSNISHIKNVKVDGVAQTLFTDYVFDIKTHNIIFYNNITGTLTYDVYSGTNWIYADKPIAKNPDSYPRLSVRAITATD